MPRYQFPLQIRQRTSAHWEGTAEVTLTDDEAERLMETAESVQPCELEEDPACSDICLKVRMQVFEQFRQQMIRDGRMAEMREKWLGMYARRSRRAPTDDELTARAMGRWKVRLPEEFHVLSREPFADPEKEK